MIAHSKVLAFVLLTGFPLSATSGGTNAYLVGGTVPQTPSGTPDGNLSSEAPAAAQANDESAALTRGLAAIRESRFRADLEFFASDSMRGRNTPSPELHIAALYLKSRVEAKGFEPGAREGWFQDYPVFSQRLDSNGTGVMATLDERSTTLMLGADYFFQTSKQAFALDIESNVICAGSASEAELEGLDLQGKWALVLDRGKFLKRAIQRCEQAGAAGVVATPGPEYKRDSYSDKYGERSRDLFQAGKLRLELPAADLTSFPVLMLGRNGARLLFGDPNLWGAKEPHTPDGDVNYPATGAELELRLRDRRTVVVDKSIVHNLCAFWPGSDPELAKETMVLTAHYDHVGVRDGNIYNGADDNASGTSGLLALADALVAYGPMQRSVLLLWVSGEEKGLWGSEVWVNDPWLPNGSRPVMNINMDMIGRAPKDELYITPTMDHDSFNVVSRAAYDLAGTEGFGDLIGQDQWWGSSDHKNFDVELGLPAIFLSAGDHDDYHKPTDTAGKIDAAKSARIMRVVLRILDRLQSAPLPGEK